MYTLLQNDSSFICNLHLLWTCSALGRVPYGHQNQRQCAVVCCVSPAASVASVQCRCVVGRHDTIRTKLNAVQLFPIGLCCLVHYRAFCLHPQARADNTLWARPCPSEVSQPRGKCTETYRDPYCISFEYFVSSFDFSVCTSHIVLSRVQRPVCMLPRRAMLLFPVTTSCFEFVAKLSYNVL
jgi:hypothetical protein